MDGKTLNYVIGEGTGSGLVNGVLNLIAGYAIFRTHTQIPTTGPDSLLMDTIGETFLVTFGSVLVPTLIARRRRRAGTLPISGERPVPQANPYLRALVIGVLFTCLCVPLNALLLPRMFPTGVRFGHVLLFKTLYGVVLGAIATMLALRRALREVN